MWMSFSGDVPTKSYLRYIGKKAENLPEEYKMLIEEKKDYYDELMRKIS